MSEFDDKDLDLDDIAGEITNQQPIYEEAPVQVPGEPCIEKAPDEWRDTLDRLITYTEKNETWICIPEVVEGKVVLREGEIHECNSEFFFQWLCYAWAPSASMNHKPEDYDEPEYRERAHRSVCNIHKLCRIDQKPKETKKVK